LLNSVATPHNLLKLATQTRGAYAVIPPIQCLPARSDDEAASDPPDMPSKVGKIWIFQLQGLKSLERQRERERGRSDEVPRLPIESRTPSTQEELSQLPLSAGILPDGGEGPVKRSMEGDDVTRDINNLKPKPILKTFCIRCSGRRTSDETE